MKSGKYIQNLVIKDSEVADNTAKLVFNNGYKNLSKDQTTEIFEMPLLSELFNLWHTRFKKIQFY